MEDTQHIVNLLRKYLREDLTEAESLALRQWADSAPEYRQYLDSLTVGDRLPNDLKRIATRWSGGGDELQKRLTENVLNRASLGGRPPHQLPADPSSDVAPRIRRWLPYVAAVIGIALAYGVYVHQISLRQGSVLSGNFMAMEVITPGGNRATLTLADGSAINLSDDQDGIIIHSDHIKYNDGSDLVVTQRDSEEALFSTSVNMLALTTPKGGQYQITLPDGTKVWLNAASTLKYPSRFVGEDRRVELEGEAYFEVAHDHDKPFLVKSEGQEVRVLGTHFNINTYDQDIRTSLLEGSVQVAALGAHRQFPAAYDPVHVLTPGQQSIIRPGNRTINVQTIDTKSVIAWKEGYFYFSGDLSGILGQLSRWYDVDVIYTKNADVRIRIDGRVSRAMTLNKLLTYLEEATGNVKFDLQSHAGERRIIVK